MTYGSSCGKKEAAEGTTVESVAKAHYVQLVV